MARALIGGGRTGLGSGSASSPAGVSSNPAFSIFALPDSPYPPGSGVVALTFDDGPSPGITPGVLDTLARYGAPATFFVVGQYVAARPDLVQRAIADGNSVQRPTKSHGEWAQRAARHHAAGGAP